MTHIDIPADLRAEIAADLAAGGDRATRWRQPSPHPVVVLARGEDAWPVGWTGTLADITDHGGVVTGPSQPHPAAATAWAPVGGLDGGPRPDVDDRVLIHDSPDGGTGQVGTVGMVDNITGRIGVDLDHGRSALATRWAILPPTPDLTTGLEDAGIIAAQPTRVEASEPDKPHAGPESSPTAAGDWTAIDGRSNTSPEFLALCDAVERIIRGDAFTLISGRADKTARLVVAQLAHTHGLRPPGDGAAPATVPPPAWGTAERYRSALAEIGNMLGPGGICTCEHVADCGLRQEASEALRIARAALETGDAT